MSVLFWGEFACRQNMATTSCHKKASVFSQRDQLKGDQGAMRRLDPYSYSRPQGALATQSRQTRQAVDLGSGNTLTLYFWFWDDIRWYKWIELMNP
jgi:hypothetical protein